MFFIGASFLGTDWKAKYYEVLEKYNILIKLYQELQETLQQAKNKTSELSKQIDTLLEYEPMIIKLQKKIKVSLSFLMNRIN